MIESPVEEYNKLAKITVTLENDWDYKKTHLLVENKVIRDNSYAYAADIRSIVEDYDHLEEKYSTKWYRGTETVMSENPYSNWLTKKNWPLNEELNLHMLLFQQAGLINRNVPYQQWSWSEGEGAWRPLGIEDFQLQFLTLGLFCCIGLLLSLGELLASSYTFNKLTLCGLAACSYVATLNLFLFALLIVTDDLEVDWGKAVDRQGILLGILGVSGGTFYTFILCALVKCSGL